MNCSLIVEMYLKTSGPGYGIVIKINNDLIQLNGKLKLTNFAAALFGVIKGLREVPNDCSVTIFSDIEYIVESGNRYLLRWRKNGWRLRNGQPIANKDKWQIIDQLREEKSLLVDWAYPTIDHQRLMYSAESQAKQAWNNLRYTEDDETIPAEVVDAFEFDEINLDAMAQEWGYASIEDFYECHN